MKKIPILILAFIICGLYVGHIKQQNSYKGIIEVYLQAACNNLLFTDFGEHTTSIDVRKTDDNVFVNSETSFDIYNNILMSYTEGRSFVYFNDSAPQEITCTATLLPIFETDRQITNQTKISFNFIGPRFLPDTYKSKLANSEHIYTIDQINKIFRLGSLLKVTEKPPIKFYGVIPI